MWAWAAKGHSRGAYPDNQAPRECLDFPERIRQGDGGTSSGNPGPPPPQSEGAGVVGDDQAALVAAVQGPEGLQGF